MKKIEIELQLNDDATDNNVINDGDKGIAIEANNNADKKPIKKLKKKN